VSAEPKFVAIIPARGGSKRLPRKNLLPILGKPLLAYSVEAAKGCGFVDGIYVSTEDEEIAAAARSFGAEVIDRPVELASDTATSRDVVLHALDELESQGSSRSHFALLQPTSPQRTSLHLSECISRFASGRYGCAISVCEAEHHPSKMLAMDESGTLVPFGNASDLDKPLQSLGRVYRQNGAIYLMKCDDFRTRATGFFLAPAMPFVMSARESVDIDSETDFLFASALMEAHR
jgi:CMP-N-acetylneuraminic acid synthetase